MIGGGLGKRSLFSVKSSTLRVADIMTSLRGLPFYRMHEYTSIAVVFFSGWTKIIIYYDQTVGSIYQVGAGKPVVFHLYVLCGILKIYFRTILVNIWVVCMSI